MTLYRQLIIFTLILFFVLLTGTWMATFENNRSFLINQLNSHAQDTATSLALAISQSTVEKDKVGMEAMISAVFDRGYYQTIKLADLKGKVLSERKLSIIINEVPRWFIRLVPIETPEATSYIMTGWRQAGTIYVKSHPGYAYKTLWFYSIRITIWFIACGLFIFLIGALGLRMILRPLARVQQQADAICRKEYTYQEDLPRTRELRQVVTAMNRMVNKVKVMFEEQVAIAEEFRKHAYYDSLTGLGNRRYFEGQIQACLEQRDKTAKGIFLLVQLNDLNSLNHKMGLEAGDALLKKAASVLQEATEPYPNHVLARLTGGDFSIFLPDALPGDAEAVAADVTNKLCRLAMLHIPGMDSIAHTGAVTFEFPSTPGLLLSEADRALRTAQQTGPNSWHVTAITEETGKMPAGQQQWKQTLERALQAHKINLDVQPVVRTVDRGAIRHLEILSRIIHEDGQVFDAGVFLPYAERLGLIALLDRIVLEEVIRLDRNQLPVDHVAVNISPTSLCDPSFMEWIRKALKKPSQSAPRVTFEFSEFAAIHNLSLIKDFQTFAHDCGHTISLDHFGQAFSNFAYLRSLHPEYVKIDRAYTGEIKDIESDTRFYAASLCNIAHSVDVAVIAVGVETELQYELLRDLNIDAVQGFFIEPPKPIAFYLKGR